MKVLWIRLSSLGDVVHTLPAITDLAKHGFVVDVLTEKNFACLLKHHHHIQAIKTVQLRMLKRSPLKFIKHILAIRRLIRHNAYDAIIDAQGLWKSALLGWRMAPFVIGGDAASVRESGVYRLYRQTVCVDLSQNVMVRYRQLAAYAAVQLGIEAQQTRTQLETPIDFALPTSSHIKKNTSIKKTKNSTRTILLLHGVSDFRRHKMWPATHWQALTHRLHQEGMTVLVPWHGHKNSQEHRFAKLLEKSGALILPPLSLEALIAWLIHGKLDQNNSTFSIPVLDGVVSVDSGLGHLTNALNFPEIMLFGPTSARRFSTAHRPWQISSAVHFYCAPCGLRICQRNVESGEKIPPCWSTLSAEDVYETLMKMIHKDA